MRKKLGATAAMMIAVTLAGMSAQANDGLGMSNDPAASLNGEPVQVYAVQDLEVKLYINDDDKVYTVFPMGTIFTMDQTLYRDGQDSGWGTAYVMDPDTGGETYGFFQKDLAAPYGVVNGAEVELSEDKFITVRVPVSVVDEQFEVSVSDENVLDIVTSEETDDQFVVSFMITAEENAAATILCTDEQGKKVDEFVVNLQSVEGSHSVMLTEVPLTFEDISGRIDHEEVLYTADGEGVKAYMLNGGIEVDMNGYLLVGIADTACMRHDGEVLYNSLEAK